MDLLKTQMLTCFSLTYFLHFIQTFCLQMDMTDTAKFEKVKVQNSVGLKCKLYKAMLKVPSFWRGFRLDGRYTSEEENSRGHSFPSSLLCHMTLTNTDTSNTHTLRCANEQVFFKSRVTSFIAMILLAPGEECHLDFSSKSCTNPTLVTIDPLEVKIISILLYKNSYFPMLFCTFTIDNGSFLTNVKKKNVLCMVIFSKKVSDL